MSDEKFGGYYIDILKNTLNEQILQNISLKATLKVTNDNVEELYKKLEGYNPSEIQNLKLQLEKNSNDLENLKKSNSILQSQVNETNKLRNEIEQYKAKASHIDTFKNEIIKYQKDLQNKDITIGELKAKIEELSNPISNSKTKKKKVTEVKKAIEINSPPPKVVSLKKETTLRDGGSF